MTSISKQKPALLILAAGLGSRFGGLKQLDRLGPSGEALMEYSIYDAMQAGFGKVVLVIRKALQDEFDTFLKKKLAGRIALQYVFQEVDNLPPGLQVPAGRTKPWGTAHAIMVAESAINEPFMVVNADDFYGREAFNVISNYLEKNHNEMRHCMAGYRLGQTLSDFGPVSRGICVHDHEMNLKRITEITRIERSNGQTGFADASGRWQPLDDNVPVSMNAWGFYPSIFKVLKEGFEAFLNTTDNLLQKEYFISHPLNHMIANKLGSIRILETQSQWFGLTYPDDKPLVAKQLLQLTEAGLYPSKLWN
jgi:UTP-glucose-1-phosphate uridylyltransferase